jgi:hypothetical protein
MDMKETKEELKRINTIQAEKLKILEQETWRIRRVFSELLDSWEYVQNSFGVTGGKRETKIQSWEGIAFLIGELKSDAEYSCVLESRNILSGECERLKMRIKELEHPEQEGRDKRVDY